MRNPRVVSLVPSWTETLLDCRVQVVGRTRFCIHPDALVAGVPAVGGTKDADWKKIESLKPDFVLMDKEENTREMFDACPLPTVVTHVVSVHSMPAELGRLADALQNAQLADQARRWEAVLKLPPPLIDPIDLPGVKNWWRRPTTNIKTIYYIIWKKPWMQATKTTFIGSLLCALLDPTLMEESASKYPELSLAELDQAEHLFLFSTEPYPFEKFQDQIGAEFTNASMALVDGESYSWFGSRSLRFFEVAMGKMSENQ